MLTGFKSFRASAQSDKSLCFPPEEMFDAWLPIERPSKTDQTAGMQSDLSLPWMYLSLDTGSNIHYVFLAIDHSKRDSLLMGFLHLFKVLLSNVYKTYIKHTCKLENGDKIKSNIFQIF